MKKELYMKDLKSIQDMASKIRTLNESMSFADEYDDEDMPMDGMDQEEEEEGQPQDVMTQEERPLNKMGNEGGEANDASSLGDEVDAIRELALKGMIKLCKTPEDPRYDALKKIFNFCDKAVEAQKKDNEQ